MWSQRCAARCIPSDHLRALAALVMLWLLQQSPPATAEGTLSDDKTALLVFMRAYTVKGRAKAEDPAAAFFETWQEGSDPCLDEWDGVVCDVLPSDPEVLRVTELRVVGNDEQYLQGILLADVSSLSAIRLLDFSSNSLIGAIPTSYSRLELLQYFNMSHNQLSGHLPSFLSSNADLAVADMTSNNFHGGLPVEWCGSRFTAMIAGNDRLCGTVPACDGAPYPTISGGSDAPYLAMGNVTMNWTCDETPPTCGDHCRADIDRYTTQVSHIDYEFSGFQDDSGITRYEVAVASPDTEEEYVRDWMPFDGKEYVAAGTNITYYRGTVSFDESNPLQQGRSYYVLIKAWNGAGPPLQAVEKSGRTVVSLERPVPGAVYTSGMCTDAVFTTRTEFLEGCWEGFTDAVVGVLGFYAQVYDIALQKPSTPRFFAAEKQGNPVILYLDNDDPLRVDSSYFIRVWAVNNAAEMTAPVDSKEIAVRKINATIGGADAVSTRQALTVAIVAFGVIILVAFGLVICLVQRRYIIHKKQQTRAHEHTQMVKTLISQLEQAISDEGLSGSTIRMCKELAFVTTDLMDSTKMAAASVSGFQQVQDIHDTVMREAISRYSGYEINTEGDAFQVAFRDVFDAVKFCTHVQYRLLEVPWSRLVLKLPSCKEVYSVDGQLLFKGPRVRMGIHWAKKGTFSQRLHPLTKHRIFAGPSWRIAQELGDGANGGQVLITHDVWNMVRCNMAKAHYPVVQQIGLFKFDATSTPMWVYEVKELLNKPLRRSFGLPRDITLLENGWALNIMTPPVKPGDGGNLSVVALVLKPPPEYVQEDLPPAMSQRLYEQLAIQVMQFRGYIFRVNKKRGYFLVAFGDTMDALRFCHSFQLMIMFITWPPEAEPFCDAQVIGPDGRYIFNGPRVAMAVNEESSYTAVSLHNNHPHREDAVDYNGPCVEHAKELSSVVHGGQVVLTQHAWIAVQDHIPGQAQALSLGVHSVSPGMKEPCMLMQVMPGVLIRRTFPNLNVLEQHEPGYLSSPDPSKDMAIVFVKVTKPLVVKSRERMLLHKRTDIELGNAPGLDDEDLIVDKQDAVPNLEDIAQSASINASDGPDILKLYDQSIRMFEDQLRDALKRFHGYECKEPEPGKFTLAFSCLEEAVLCGTTLQEELLHLQWPEEMLELEEAREEFADPETEEVQSAESEASPSSPDVVGQPLLIFRGLRVQMGLAYGRVASRKPLNTGRADYFGNLPNTAARVMSLAKPGQFLIEGSAPWPTPLFTKLGGRMYDFLEGRSFRIAMRDQDQAEKLAIGFDVGETPPTAISNMRKDSVTGEPWREAVISHFGHFLLKGLDEPKLILQASTPALKRRTFQASNNVAPTPSGNGGNHLARLFAPSKQDTSKPLTVSRKSFSNAEPSPLLTKRRQTYAATIGQVFTKISSPHSSGLSGSLGRLRSAAGGSGTGGTKNLHRRATVSSDAGTVQRKASMTKRGNRSSIDLMKLKGASSSRSVAGGSLHGTRPVRITEVTEDTLMQALQAIRPGAEFHPGRAAEDASDDSVV